MSISTTFWFNLRYWTVGVEAPWPGMFCVKLGPVGIDFDYWR